jgi:hypothetical protein
VQCIYIYIYIYISLLNYKGYLSCKLRMVSFFTYIALGKVGSTHS